MTENNSNHDETIQRQIKKDKHDGCCVKGDHGHSTLSPNIQPIDINNINIKASKLKKEGKIRLYFYGEDNFKHFYYYICLIKYFVINLWTDNI